MGHLINLFLLCALATTGCTGTFLKGPPATAPIKNKRFVMVTVKPGDTFASLARIHLKDEEKAWQIAAYNRIKALTPGRKVVIPRIPLQHGGIVKDGFQTVPVLLYRDIATSPSNPKTMDAVDFDRHLQYLKKNKYTTITLNQFQAFLSLETQLPPNAFVISFETTRCWVYDIAFPLLKRHLMKAAIFIRLNEIGTKDRLTWTQLDEMAAAGFDIGVYGSKIEPPSNKNLIQYFARLDRSYVAAQKAFKTHLKKTCRYFAYADGVSDDLSIALLKKHGYRLAFTRQQGSNPFFADNFKLKRNTIQGHFDMAQFRQSLITSRSAELK